MPTKVLLYIITFGISIILIAGYLFVRFGLVGLKKYDAIRKWTVRGIIIFMIACFVSAYFFQDHIMKQGLAPGDSTRLSGGLIQLVGSPYGENKIGNFFALLQLVLLYPCLLGLSLIPFYPFATGKRIVKFIILPLSVLEAVFLFNGIKAIYGTYTINYKEALTCLEFGSLLAASVVYSLEVWNDEDAKFNLKTSSKKTNALNITHLIVFFVMMMLFTLPIYTMGALINQDAKMFGRALAYWKVLDFSLMHRIFLYATLGIPVVIYFLCRSKSLNTRQFVVLYVTLGALMLFTTNTNFQTMFPIGSDGVRHVSATNLPIHLCHTALYVTPICIITKSKRLFYFTYFINVFGAMCAMLMPNYSEFYSVLNPNLFEFWANHMIAFYAPLLSVALGLFEKPKFKQMLWSLLFFFVYFVVIVFANAWLSNYVNGFDPEVIGTGTDYLFINGDFILGKLGDNSMALLNSRIVFNWGNCIFVIYPIYQVLFFLGYIGIAFAMWFLYSLFFRIADAHNELRIKLIIAKQENISFKEQKKLLEERNMEIKDINAKLELIHFSKRYGNSDTLSANDVNLTVNAGEIFGYLGPNGAGKSTCIKTIIGIQPVTDGQIKVCGYDVMEEPVLSKRLIGYVPDHYALYEKLTGREYINYIADLYGVNKEDRDARIAKYVDLFELTQAFDNRMQTYSHGMKQKMTIMAALVHNPKVWILDEPLTGLDPQSIYQVKLCMIQHAKEGNIVFFSSHIIDVVEKLCTRIAIIKKGHIVYENSMEGVLKDHPEGLEKFYMETIRDNGDND